jgi:hypothetical protein
MRLKGDALCLFNDEGPRNLIQLMTILESHYTSKSKRQRYLNEYNSRMLAEDEPMDDFVNDLKRFGRRAYEQGSASLEPHIQERFLHGLGDPEMEKYLRLQGYDTLDDLKNAADRYRTLYYKSTPRRSSPPAQNHPMRPVPKARAAYAAEAPESTRLEDSSYDLSATIEEALKKGQQQMMSMTGQYLKQLRDNNAVQVSQVNPPVVQPPAVATRAPVDAPTGQRPVALKRKFKMDCINCGEDHRFQQCPYCPDYKPTVEQKAWFQLAKNAKGKGVKIGPPPINVNIVYGPGIPHKDAGVEPKEAPVAQPQKPPPKDDPKVNKLVEKDFPPNDIAGFSSDDDYEEEGYLNWHGLSIFGSMTPA